MMENYHALILAGGIGARLWPKSRVERPKQFLALSGRRSLLAKTMNRAESLFPKERIWVVCKPYQRDEVRRQLPQLDESNIITEPVPKGTAAAVLLGSLIIEQRYPDAVVSVFPSDHFISPEERFSKFVRAGMDWAATHDSVVIYGIRPDCAETSYGYIETGSTVGQCMGWNCMEVTSFHEKPDPATAQAYFSSKRYLWNSGMLSFAPRVLSKVLMDETFSVWRPVGEILKNVLEGRFQEAARLYQGLPDDAFDTAVLERLARCAGGFGSAPEVRLVVFPCDFEWFDLGVWESYYRMFPKDEQGNAVKGHAFTLDCTGSLVMSEGKTLIGAIGLKDMVVVCVDDAILVCPRHELDRVKELVESLRKNGYEDYT
ncbi:MAG: NTP transferase domain-containing protein [Thermodesulfobacteria bacterium]|nr:NTP transferase domain-containing protein [Thermodesulfobacteriota bacterium]